MKILVCLSSVPDTTSKINFSADHTSFDKTGVQFVINPYDEFGLSKAVKMQQSNGATVTVVTVGDNSVEPVMRKALAIGANDAIRVNAAPKDSLAVAKELAKVAKDGAYDLVICGKESIDYNGGIVPGFISSMLDVSFVNGCIGLNLEGTSFKATREIDGGKEIVSANLPAVIAGQKGLVEENELIIPNMRGIMQARSKKLEVIEPSYSDVAVETLSFEKPVAKAGVKLATSVDELVKLLNEEAKVF